MVVPGTRTHAKTGARGASQSLVVEQAERTVSYGKHSLDHRIRERLTCIPNLCK